MLSKERNTPRRGVGPVLDVLEIPVAANAVIYQGALVVVNAGYAERGSAALNLIAVGRAQSTVSNAGGLDGDQRIRVERGVFRFNNSAGADEITQADLLQDAYVVDDESVARTDGSGARSKAGRIMDVDDYGVYIELL